MCEDGGRGGEQETTRPLITTDQLPHPSSVLTSWILNQSFTTLFKALKKYISLKKPGQYFNCGEQNSCN